MCKENLCTLKMSYLESQWTSSFWFISTVIYVYVSFYVSKGREKVFLLKDWCSCSVSEEQQVQCCIDCCLVTSVLHWLNNQWIISQSLNSESYISITSQNRPNFEGQFTRHSFQQKTENFICALAVHVHDNAVLGSWKNKLLRKVFKLFLFFNYTLINIISV